MTRADRLAIGLFVLSTSTTWWVIACVFAVKRLPLVDGLTLACLCGALLLPCGWAEWARKEGE